MKKMKATPHTAQRVKSIAAAAMVAILAVPTTAYFAEKPSTTKAKEAAPEAVLTVDFDHGFMGENAENGLTIVKSENILMNEEKMDPSDRRHFIYNEDKSKVYDITDEPSIENGYYKYGVMGNQPTTKYDAEKGSVLMLRETVKVEEQKKEKDDIDREYANDDIDMKYPIGCTLQYPTVAESQVTITNPFVGKDLSQGASVSYWVKVPAGEDGKGQNSSLIVFGVKEEDNLKVDSIRGDGVYNTDKDAEKEAESKLSIQITANNDFHYVVEGKDAFAYTGDGEVLEHVNAWVYVTVSMTDSEIVTYVNGVETNRQAVTTAGLTDALKDTNTGVFFGGNYSIAAETVNQKIGTVNDVCLDDVAFYTQAISAEEADVLYAAAKTAKETIAEPAVIETFDFEDGLTGRNGTTLGNIDTNRSEPEVVVDGQRGNVLKLSSGTNTKTAGAILSSNPFAGKNLTGATINYWVKGLADPRSGQVNPSISMSFIDTPKPMMYDKVSESRQGDSRTVLYTKTDLGAYFEEGYTTYAYEDLKNSYEFSTKKNEHTDDKVDSQGNIIDVFYDLEAVALEKEYEERKNTMSEWHMITVVFTNAGIQMYYDGEPLSNNLAEAYEYLDSAKTKCRPTYAGSRFYDGFYQMIYGGYAKWHRYSNNQGAKPLMTFLTDTTTSAYVGYMYKRGTEVQYERTYEAYYDNITYYATALTAEQVRQIKNDAPIPTIPPKTESPSTEPAVTTPPVVDANQGFLGVGEDGMLHAQAAGVAIETAPGVLPEGAILLMGTLGKPSDAAAYEKFDVIIDDIRDLDVLADANGAKQYIIYTVTALDETITPNGTFKLSLTIPDRFDASSLTVIDENGKIYDVIVSEDGEKVTIETDHFGQYALAVKNISTDDEILYGDLTGDGKVNLDDAYLALKAAMNIVTLTDEQKEIAGVALDGNISLDDVKQILRMALKIK